MKKFFGIALSLVFFFSLVLMVSAQTTPEIPERNGDFPVPGRSDLRVRVFVHEPKEKPTLSTSAVCEDGPSDAIVGATGWKLPGGTWKYKINPSSVPSSVGGSNLATIVSNSFNKWTSAINSSSTPNLVSNGTTSKTRNALDYENIITWGRTQGSALGVTYIWYYTATNLVADVDTIMNKKFPWSLACSTASYNAEDILIHELGHWFGLDDEYNASYVNNTMYGYGSKAENKKITLEQGDKDGIDLIY